MTKKKVFDLPEGRLTRSKVAAWYEQQQALSAKTLKKNLNTITRAEEKRKARVKKNSGKNPLYVGGAYTPLLCEKE